MSKTSAWAEGTVVTKETVRAYIQALERAGAVMGLCDNNTINVVVP